MSANPSTPQTKPAKKLSEGTYFTRYGRLYYVVDVNWKLCKYKIENCETLVTEWMTSEELQTVTKDIRIINNDATRSV